MFSMMTYGCAWLFNRTHNKDRRIFAWRLHHWMDMNAGWFIYAFVMGAIALQQFEVTEPMAFGFFWINMIAFVVGGGMFYYDSDFRNVIIKVLAVLIAIALQAYLIAYQWEILCLIDNGLKGLRTIAFGNHLIPGWIIGTLLTALRIRVYARQGKLFYPIHGKPPYFIGCL